MKTNKNLIAITATAIVSLGLLASWAIGFKLGSKKIIQTNQANTNEAMNAGNLYVEEEQKFSQSGIITQIEGNTVFIKGQAVEQGVQIEKIYSVLTDANTVFKKINMNNNIAESDENIKLDDLKEGDNIIALSNENIKEITQFKAKQINLNILN